MLLNKDGASGVANWIWQIIDLSIFGLFDFVLSGFGPVHQDSAVFVVSHLSAVTQEQLNKLEAFFFSLHSAKYQRE